MKLVYNPKHDLIGINYNTLYVRVIINGVRATMVLTSDWHEIGVT